MEFLMQPVNSRTLLEEVTDSEIPMEPLHYPVLPPPPMELPAATASSVDERICAAEAGGRVESEGGGGASEHSIDQIDPKTPGWTRRVRIGAAAPGRVHCPGRMTAFEKSVRVFAESPNGNVIIPKIGDSFDTLGEAYDFCAKDQHFTYRVQADKEGRISTLMWANGNSRLHAIQLFWGCCHF